MVTIKICLNTQNHNLILLTLITQRTFQELFSPNIRSRECHYQEYTFRLVFFVLSKPLKIYQNLNSSVERLIPNHKITKIILLENKMRLFRPQIK